MEGSMHEVPCRCLHLFTIKKIWIYHSHFVSCEHNFIFWGLCILFFQKSKWHLWFLSALCGNCKFDYDNRFLCSMCGCWVRCFKVGICLWDVIVGARLLYYMGKTSQGRGSIPLEEIMFICVCVFIFILHFEVYKQKKFLVFKLVAKFSIFPYTK
jgi:hypothetical protein